MREIEGNFNIAECFDKQIRICTLIPDCRLKTVLAEALHASLNILDAYTLADLIIHRDTLQSLIT